MKLNKIAFAHSFAVLSAIFLVVLYVLQTVAFPVFSFLLNVQFYGADVASLTTRMTLGAFVQVLVGMVALSWVAGWLVAYFYNRFSK